MSGRLILALILVLLCPVSFADRVVLKTGESFDGTIIERTDEYIKIQTGGAPVYLSMDQVLEIGDSDSGYQAPEPAYYVEPKVEEYSPPENVPYVQQPITPAPVVEENNGQYYYQRAKQNFQNGKFNESLQDLNNAIALGVEDVDGLKGKITTALNVTQTIDTQKTEIKKAVEQLDPGVQVIVYRGGAILILIIILFILVKVLTREKKESDVATFLKTQRGVLTQPIDVDGFIKAGPNKRVCAYFIDMCVIAAPSLVVQLMFGSMFSAIISVVFLLIKDCLNGQSIGKKLVGLRIVDQDNYPIGPNQAVLRNLYWVVVCVLPVLHPYLIFASIGIVLYEYVGIHIDAEGQRFGDKISLTRVHDLKPRVADWKFIFLTFLALMTWFAISLTTVFVMAKVLNRPELIAPPKEFRDSSNRFSMRIPYGFEQSKEAPLPGVYVFESMDKAQRLTVMSFDKTEVAQLAKLGSDQLSVAYMALKMKTDAPTILANTTMSYMQVSGVEATVFVYETDQGKNVSVCLVRANRFFEIHLMSTQEKLDQQVLNSFLSSFRILS